MTLKEMFVKAHSLPVDEYGLFKLNGHEILHVYHSGAQINVIDGDNVIHNIIDYQNKFDIVPVENGRSRWESAIPCKPDTQSAMLPEKILDAFIAAGVLS